MTVVIGRISSDGYSHEHAGTRRHPARGSGAWKARLTLSEAAGRSAADGRLAVHGGVTTAGGVSWPRRWPYGGRAPRAVRRDVPWWGLGSPAPARAPRDGLRPTARNRLRPWLRSDPCWNASKPNGTRSRTLSDLCSVSCCYDW